MKADLHIHTTASDGTATPTEAVKWAKAEGAGIIAITDHDSVDALDEASVAALNEGLEFVSGIELSAYAVCEIHILGYAFDWHNHEFVQDLEAVKAVRRERNIEIGKKLAARKVTLDLDFSAAGLGRLNIARAMVAAGYVRDINEAFARYLGVGGLAYTEAKRLTPIEAVRMLKKYGALISIAHPKKFLSDGRLDMLLGGLVPHGLGGLEVNYPGHTDRDIAALNAACRKYSVLPTGGSDFHGDDEKRFVYDLDERTYARITGKTTGERAGQKRHR